MLAFQNAKERTDDWTALQRSRSEIRACKDPPTVQVVVGDCGVYLGRLNSFITQIANAMHENDIPMVHPSFPSTTAAILISYL